MSITTVLFDLDGTLLPMDQDVFVKDYFSRIAAKVAPFLKEYTLLAPYAENISLVLVVFIITYVSVCRKEVIRVEFALNLFLVVQVRNKVVKNYCGAQALLFLCGDFR